MTDTVVLCSSTSKTTHVDTVVEKQEGGAQREKGTTTIYQTAPPGMGQSVRFCGVDLGVIRRNEVMSPRHGFSADGSRFLSLSKFLYNFHDYKSPCLQVGRQDSMNLMPLHCLRFGPRSNRCEHEFQRVRRLRPSENSLLEQRTKTSTILLAPKAAAFLGPRTTTEEHIYGCMSDDWVCIGKVIYLSIQLQLY